MVEISLSGSGEGPGAVGRGYSTALAEGPVDQEIERTRREEHGREGLIIQASSPREVRPARSREPVAALRSRSGEPSLRSDPGGMLRNGRPDAAGTGGAVGRNTHVGGLAGGPHGA